MAGAHLVQTWKLSTDPEFIAKVRDVVGLYMSPPEHALVLAVDEKSQITRRWTAQPRACRSCPPRPSAGRTTMYATARPACSPPMSWATDR